MIQHCRWCGRAFDSVTKQECCSKECKEDLKRSREPLCPHFSHERYGRRGAIYCEGGVIKLRLKSRKEYIKNNCQKISGGECTIRKQLDKEV